MDYFSNKHPFFRRWFKLKEKLYVNAIENGILNSTCQFFLDNSKNDKPRPHGSGVFIEYNDTKYLISAAHVLEKHYQDTFIILERDSIVLGGTLFVSKLPKGCDKREDDYRDIAVIRLCPETIEFLEEHNVTFVNSNRLDNKHEIEKHSIYLTFGYPAAKTDLRFKYTVQPFAMETSVITKDKTYTKYKISKSDNIVAKYHRKGIFTNSNPLKQFGVKPYGISGCGLWLVKNLNPENNLPIPTTLVGIFTTWISNDSNMIATHISDVLYFIDNEIE